MTARTRASPERSSPPRFGRLASVALLLSASFVLSRVLGVLRNTAIAAIFDNSGPINAYFAAFRIPDTMFTLVSGAALASAFVPTFAGLLARNDEDEAWDVASTVLNSVFLALAAFGAVAFLFAPLLMQAIVPGFPPAQRDLTVQLTRIMLLQPIFLGVASIVTSVLQSYNRFVLTAIAPLVYNVSVILGALLFGRSGGVSALAWSVVLGAVAYFLIQLPGISWRNRYRLEINWHTETAREVLRLLAPRVVGLAAFQAMLLITLFLASRLPPGSVGAINYSWPLIMLPVGALGTAAATAIFPTLSRFGAVEDISAVRVTLARSLRLVLFLALPASIGLIVLRRPIVNLLYNHGAWTFHDTEQTAYALLFYAMAIGPLSIIEVLARVFYAMKDTMTPVRIAIIAVAIDAALSIFFVAVFPHASGQGGLALATAIASSIQVIWLTSSLNGRLGGIGLRGLLLTFRDAGVASLIMGMLLYITLDPLTAVFGQRGVGVFITVGIELCLGAGAFFAVTHALDAPELWQVRRIVLREK